MEGTGRAVNGQTALVLTGEIKPGYIVRGQALPFTRPISNSSLPTSATLRRFDFGRGAKARALR